MRPTMLATIADINQAIHIGLIPRLIPSFAEISSSMELLKCIMLTNMKLNLYLKYPKDWFRLLLAATKYIAPGL